MVCVSARCAFDLLVFLVLALALKYAFLKYDDTAAFLFFFFPPKQRALHADSVLVVVVVVFFFFFPALY